MRVRLAVHVVASSLSVPPSHPFHFLRTLILDPERCVNSYLPAMPEDMTKMAQNVMGGRWYACPNNHPFYVDLCGRPTRIQVCPDCGAQIGGEDHNLLEDNVDLGGVGTDLYQSTVLEDKSEKNYCLRSAEEETAADRFFTARTLTAPAARIIRFVLHSALLSGSCSFTGAAWDTEADALFNRTYCNPTDMTAFLTEHLMSDWAAIKALLARSNDDVSVLIHHSLLTVCEALPTPAWDAAPPVPQRPHANTTGGDGVAMSTLRLPADREVFEVLFGGVHIGRFTHYDEADLSKMLEEITASFMSEEDDAAGLFAVELQEKFSYESLSLEERRQHAPALWQFHKPFSYEDFTVSLNLLPQAADKYPVLWNFLLQDRNQLRALRHLPAAFEWFRFLRGKYNGHLDREHSRIITNGDALESIEDGDTRRKWEEVFEGFAAVWNDSWANVQKYGCIQFPSDFNNLRMDRNVPISFSLPNEVDEGNCPLALAHFLIDKHNTFAQLVDESRLLRARLSSQENDSDSSTSASNRVQVISSHFLTAAHTIRCDVVSDLVPLLEKYCREAGSKQRSGGYDFAKAEIILMDRFLADIPAVDLEMPGFTFVHEQHLRGGMAQLRQKLRQEPIKHDIVRAIQRDIQTPAQAQHVLELLETVVAFLSATGGSIVRTLDEMVGNMLLSKYVRTVLMAEDDFGSRAITQQVYLKNIEALWELLTDRTSCDIFGKVHKEYRKPLSKRAENDLQEMLKNEEFDTGRLLPVMKKFIVENLQEKIMKEDLPVSVCMGHCELDDMLLADYSWFDSLFPSSLQMQEIVEAYKFITDNQATVEVE